MGYPYDITWTTEGKVDNVIITYYDGYDWYPVSGGPIPNTGTFNWLVPNTPSNQCLVRIEEENYYAVDQSDTYFTIAPPTITVTAPNTSFAVYMGYSYDITWTTEGKVDNVIIWYTYDGYDWYPVSGGPIPNTGTFDWLVPNTPSNQCLVRIDEENLFAHDQSDFYFTIAPPTITVTFPDGSEDLTVGSSHDITWTSAGKVDNVVIRYSYDGGFAWQPVSGAPIPNTGTFTWTVPDTPSGECLVIVEEENFFAMDQSNGFFTISPMTIPTAGRDALIALYNSTDGDNWTDNTNWRDPGDPAQFNAPGTEPTWFGVTVSGTAHVQGIDLQSNSLSGTIPDLSSLTYLRQLNLSGNQLTGTIPFEIGNLAALNGLHLENNQLSGSIPVEIGNLTALTALFLQGNQLGGSIPTTLTNLTVLPTDGLNISWNGLYTTDGTLKTFLDSKQVGGDWESTQTIAPTGLAVDSVTATTASLSWTPILYQADSGTYRVYYSTISGSGYTLAGATGDKYAGSYTVTGLSPATTYYFVVETVTDPHVNNQNTVTGEYSTEVSGITGEPDSLTVISPDGSESWEAGFTQSITWSGTGSIANVMIEYSTDNGAAWNTVTASTANTGSYDWTVPNTPSPNCLVRVTDTAGPASDTSNGVFNILEMRTVVVNTPIGGEEWFVGSDHDITWATTGDMVNVSIDYSTNNGGTWNPVVGSTPNTGSFTWTIPGTPSIDCLVKVSDTAGPAADTCNAVFTISSPRIPQGQRDALIALYNSTNGDSWYTNTNWRKPGAPAQFNDPGTENTWYGVTCDAGNNNVLGVNLYQNGLSGTIPDIGGLTELTTLNLGYNQLTGNIPASLNNLTQLTVLNLKINQLDGAIPGLSNLLNLVELYLSNNYFFSSIPSWLNNFTNLTVLHLQDNSIYGPIPDLSNLTNLTNLNFGNNQLIGDIPAWLNNLTGLTELWLYSNYLSGVIPDLSNLTQLTLLSLGSNNLTGVIPASFNNLTNLQGLYLSTNSLSGPLPDLGNLTQLVTFSAMENDLSGSIDNITALTQLQWLYLNENQFSGAIPAALGNLTNLTNLHLDGNMLTGEIPGTLSNLTNLGSTNLELRWNGLYTGDPGLRDFLNSKQYGGNWESTQTIAPGGVSTGEETHNSVKVSWTPIQYQSDSGGYRVYYSTTSGSDYQLAGTTNSKTDDNFIVTGLVAETTYYFVVESFTDPHTDNENTVTSEYSTEVSASTLEQPTLAITAPNGGQSWEAATAQVITWNSTGNITDVKVEYSTDNGSSWNTVIASTPNNGSYNWTVPNTPSTDCLVKITDIGGIATDTSDAVFTIAEQKTITVTAPDGSEIWEGGFAQNITWNSTGSIANVMIEYSTDSGGSWNTVIASTANSGAYGWTVPNTPSPNCLVRISDIVGPASDTGNGVFNILEMRTIMVIAPDGSEDWQVGSSHDITWSTTGDIANVSIEYSSDGGSLWNSIIASTPNNGTYNWTIPDTPSTDCLVKVSDIAGPASDTSNAVFTISIPTITQSERDALIALYNSTNGDSWTDNTNWRKPGDPLQFNDPGTEYTWYGVFCNAEKTHVTGIQLVNNNLVGTIPDLGSLTWLTNLYLNNNQLTGSIPTGINNLVNLQGLYLYSNQLSGIIPDLSSLVNLTTLFLGYNQLSGSVPAWLNLLTDLEQLHLGSNQLTGTIPDLSSLTQLIGLGLGHNQLTGNIPDLSSLVNLEALYLGTNQLSGSIPTWINNLTNLHALELDYNDLSGPIPYMGNLTQLTKLSLHNNELTGSIPSEITNMTNLTALNLGHNHLDGSIPPAIGNLTGLTGLRLNSNQLDGTIPSELGNLTNLNYLYLDSNKLTGSIPGSLANLTNLYSSQLDISRNGLYTADTALRDFLNTKQVGGDWEATQTIAPTGIAAGEETHDSINVSWTPIPYQADSGGYNIYYSTTSGSGYTLAGTTADKTVDNYTVTGLDPFTTYYFVVTTVTNPNGSNTNTVTSEYSAEVSAATQENPTLTVTAPDGGQSWEGTTTQSITWGSTGNIPDVKIEYSTDNGNTWNTIIASTPNSGSYNWLVPNTPSGNCLVKITDTAGPASDTSNAVFTIAAQRTITVTAPDGGQNWEGGTVQNITWTSTGSIPNVKIEYSTDTGGSWNTITASVSNSGSYGWTVPGTPSANCLVKISDTAGPASDTSNAVFTILQQRAITVTAPDGSESWEGGFTRAITWNSTGSIANVMIEYSTDTGGSWNTVIASTANSGSYNWTVPNTPSSNCSVRITDTAGPASDTSNGVFTITEQRTLTITVPNDGESWEVDSNQTITWLSTGNIVNVRLEYSTDGGGSWDTITSSTANSGSYSWNVPNDPSDNCLVKISDTAGPAWDESDVVFSITVPMIPTIEREALIALYNSTDGDNWTDNSNWRKPGEPTQFNDPGTEHTWYGVTCDAGNTFVTGINLLNNNLAGTIPVELNNLTQITSLNLGWNQLTGNIPNLGSLTGLTSLSFYNNQLTGNIPTWINNLTGLTSLHLAANQLSGAIPDLSSLVNLTYLNLSVNQLTGTIPTWINNFVNLSVLDLQSNQLTGTIPDLGNLTNLTFLNFDTNDLSGSIPAWINNLTQLTSLHMAYNQLTGVIPDISNLVQLTSIHLGYNQLTGPIPPEIATFTSLTTIRLSKNQLQGSIPTGLGNLTALRYLYLDENQLEGSIPSEIGNLTALDYLYLKGNKLVGSLPGTLSNLTGLNSGGLELRWNGLYTADTGLRDFLNTKQSGGDWESTQTIAPEGVAAGNETSDSVNVSWTPIQYQSFTGGYRVYYTTTSGSNYTLAGTTVDKTVDNYTVTGLNPGTTYYFVVETVTGSNALNQNTIVSEYSTEVSAGTLEELALTVITPNGSENWEGGTSQTITWDSSGSITTVMIEYSTDNGSSWNTVTGSTANSGSYNWTVPNTPSSDCLVKISDTGGPTSDTSNAVFTIAAQRSITVIAPNDGESWEIDSNQTITWTSTGNIVSVMIEYTTDGGSSWNTIASSTANSGSYSWDVPNDPSDNCLVKISDTAGPAWDESDAIFSITEIPPAVLFETGVVTGVGTSWQTVNLQYTYTSMVVVCSNDLGAAGLPAVCRVRNASGNSFEVMTQNPSGNALSGHDVHYIVIEEGVYTAAEHGVKMEAVKVASTATASSGSWIMESRSYNNSYTSPVVLGQVMTYNDAEWSVFWACSGSRTSPPTSGALSAGKHIAQDTDKTRNNETIGFIVLEAGTGSINDIPYTAAVGTDIVRGPDNTSTGYTYNFSSIPTASTAIISAAGMDGGDGGWPVFYGGTPLTSSSLTMAFDEDQIKDSERSHTTEQVAYAVFGTQ
jgi:Leucine-rich repeat (LRR) protein